MDMQIVIDRLFRLVRLDTTVFEEARDDPSGTVPSIIIAIVSFYIAGFGGWLWWVVQGYGDKTRIFVESFILGSVFASALWLAWIGVVFLILVNVFRYSVSFERLVRASGYAAAPVALAFLMFIPGINLGIGIAVFGLLFLLMDIAVQVSVDAQPGHVIFANFVGFLVFCFALSLLAQRDDVFSPSVFLFREPATAIADIANAFSRLR